MPLSPAMIPPLSFTNQMPKLLVLASLFLSIHVWGEAPQTDWLREPYDNGTTTSLPYVMHSNSERGRASTFGIPS